MLKFALLVIFLAGLCYGLSEKPQLKKLECHRGYRRAGFVPTRFAWNLGLC